MASKQPIKVGVIGTGNISSIYLKNSAWLTSIEIAAVVDIRREAAEAQAAAFAIPAVMTVDELLADPDIEIVLNLTIPQAHGKIALAALDAGKSVYNEKPLALTRDEAGQMVALAAEKGLRVGGAPDTFLGAGIQTCRKLIDDGAIGRSLSVTAFMMCPGHESWHPNPAFYYQAGGGPMFDMGPYYLTALVSLLGPVASVAGMVSKGWEQRTITSEPLAGQIVDVEVPTHIAGLMNFANGAVGTIVTSFDVQEHGHPHIEIYGTEATLSVPDPNTFGGPVRIKRKGGDWETVALTHPYADNSRGLGLADMAAALRTDRKHRVNGQLAYHVLDLMWAFHDSAAEARHIALESSCRLPQPMAMESEFGQES